MTNECHAAFAEPAVASGAPMSIAAGTYHNLALKNDGTVTAWAYNANGQTNVPVGLSNVMSVAAGGYHSLALKRDGTVTAWGYKTHGQATIPTG